jgi:salicylate hydroxylase
MLAFRVPDDLVYVTGAFALGADGSIPEAAKTGAAQRARFAPPDRPACAPVAWMLDMMERHVAQFHWARMQQIAPLHRALDDRVLLVGDAAHAMVPTLGQGATQAVEDAVAAALVLRDSGNLALYAALRAERIAWVRGFSRQATDTLLEEVDAVQGARAKKDPAFAEKLRRLYTDTPMSINGSWL